jgi:lysophospholipase L1-like esterase
MPRVCARRPPLVALIGCCVASLWLCACSDGQGNTGSSAGTGGVSGSSGDGGGKFAAGGTASDGGVAGGEDYSACKASQPCAVLPLGDSITEGFGSSGGGYRVELFRQARQNGKNILFVGSLQNGPERVGTDPFPKSHEGHGGYTIDSGDGHSGISGSITDQALSTYHPQIVLLMIGTNDIDDDIDVNGAPTRLASLIDDITTQAPDALLVVATIVPIDEADRNQKAVAYNAALPELVSARAKAGKHVVLLDSYALFASQPNFETTLLSDYLHPNDAGYVVLGKAFYDRIAPSLP